MNKYKKDVWYIYDRFLKKNVKRWILRSDLDIVAMAHERCVILNGVEHNVGTVKEYIQLLEEACKFVESRNPGWASHEV